jgi:hypothetical protein
MANTVTEDRSRRALELAAIASGVRVLYMLFPDVLLRLLRGESWCPAK